MSDKTEGDEILSNLLEGGHEPFYDFPCAICEEEGRYMEADKYCKECSVYMCISCIKGHNRFPLNSRHKLLDQSEFSTVSKSTLKRCFNHPSEIINIFCGDHDVVCCSICKSIQHSTCTDTQLFQDAAKGIHLSQEYQSVKSGTQSLILDVNKVLSDRKTNHFLLMKETEQAKQIMAGFREKAEKYFDKIEGKSLDDLKIRENNFVSNFNQETAYLRDAKSKAEDVIKQMEFNARNNECELFVQVKTGKYFLHEALEKINRMSESEETMSAQFKINPKFVDFLSSVDTLGTFDDTVKAESLPEPESTQAIGSDVQQASLTHAARVGLSGFAGRYKAQLMAKFNVKEISDNHTCHIVDVCQLVDGTVLVTDQVNLKLKKLDERYKLIDSVRLTSGPHSVCSVGPSYAAVSLFLDKKIQFVSTGKKLTLQSSFSTGSYCRGMSYDNGNLFVCCGDVHESSSGCIKMFNNGGVLLRSIPQASVPIRITVSDYGQHIFVTSWDSDDVIMIDFAGHIVNTFSDDDLRFPLGICTDGKGRAFVVGYDSETVVKLSPRRKKIELFLNRDINMKKPKGLCFDKTHSRILVSCLNSNELLVYSLE